jgi:hypothetical protein
MAVVRVTNVKNYLPNVIRVTMPKGKTKTVKINK